MPETYRRLGMAAAASLLALALVACGDNKEERTVASGEILEGSASDAMLPLDTVRSQPPLAPHSTAPSGKAVASGAAANAVASEAPATAASQSAMPEAAAERAPEPAN